MRPLIRFLSIFALTVFFSANGYAQNKGKASIQASAHVVQNNNVTATSSISIDQVAVNSGIHTVNPTENKAGGFSLSGRPGDEVFISVDRSARLKSKAGDNLQFDAVHPVFSHSANPRTAKTFKSATGGTASLSSREGELYVWLGGKVNSDVAKSGAYKGTYTVTIEYMN